MTVVALAGNPNSGKTTLFNRLTGLRQKVGNYPGVTVERRVGRIRLLDGREVSLIDLPGAYSLVSHSRDESIAFETLTGRVDDERPDLVVAVVDATNLERNLYLVLSVLDLGVPTVVAVNMMDAAHAAGQVLNLDALAEELTVPVVGVSAKRGDGIDELRATVAEALAHPPAIGPRGWRVSEDEERAIEAARAALNGNAVGGRRNGRTADGTAVWALMSASHADGRDDDPLHGQADLLRAVAAGRAELPRTLEDLSASVIEARYRLARRLAARAHERPPSSGPSLTDRIDQYLLHPVVGTAVFVLIMAAVFQSIFAWADPLMGLIESGVGGAQSAVAAVLPAGALRDLLVDGVVGGVGNIIVFVPQIGILFAFIAVLEDSGYLARAAFISDRLMARVGLHGRAFVPLLSGFACAVPAIMATRSIETRRDRLVTILVAPLVSCSARLPVYALIIAALFAANEPVAGVFTVGGLMMLSMYTLSLMFTVGAAFVLKHTILASPTPPLVLELPPYRWPEASSVLRRALERCAVFIRDAGTVILACSVVLWALLYFPRGEPAPAELDRQRAALHAAYRASVTRERNPARLAELAERRDAALARLEDRLEAQRVQNSFAGRVGHALEPVIEPLGYDWKIGIGLLASFAAREVFVSTMGLVYGVGEAADETSTPLRDRLRAERDEDGERVYTPLVGLSLMVFFAIALQCMSTLAAIRRETNSWRWPAFAMGYMAVLAWICAFIVYQGGRLLGFA